MELKSQISDITNDLLYKGVIEKAGTWQAIDDYKDYDMLVQRNLSFCFYTPPTISLMVIETGADYRWADEHFEERISGNPTNPGQSYKNWPYNTFTEENDPYMDGKKFSHTYQERFWPKKANIENDIVGEPNEPNFGIRYEYGDLNDVIEQLKGNHLTRQAYLPIFFPEDTGAVHKRRIPCTLGYLFNIVNGELTCNYYIRSCDALRHFRNDVYLTMRLMDYIKEKVNPKLKLGCLNMYVAHFHIFRNDIYVFRKKENL